ncbi:bifunctional metallophosphatase/5'-nucleotidase [Halosimplex halophilum]|uniref:bifunctional metallophosphatase/5'-nucleotidase n=1 Tax=Halosimplex halophilum TaxID=2559572 RepID=UPI00107F81E3|nr:5'-nucleotidase C-terminal domain-containing protein [Halosimplex halophilum]
MPLRVLHYADVEAAYDDPERIGRLAGLVDQLRDDATLVCGGGDDTGPGVLSVVTDGRQSLDFFRGVDPDAEVFGNHDFDHGLDALLSVVADSPQPWLCANATRDGARFGRDAGVEPWTVVEAGGERVGLVGVAHPETAAINPAAAPVEFADPIPAARTALDALRDRGVDRTVVVSHCGDDTALARAVDADLVLGGHDHEPRADRVAGTLVCRPGGEGRTLLEVTFEGNRPTATHHEGAGAPVHPGVAGAIRDRMAATGLADVAGTADDPIVCDMAACKRGESRLGNLITDAHRWKADADVAVNSGGGFRRREPLSGDVTAFDLVRVVPYSSDLAVIRLGGERLRDALAGLALASAPDDLPEWHFGHVSGASVVWDDAAGELREARVDGAPVDPDGTYTLATTEFFAEIETLFPAIGPGDVVETLGPQYEAVVEYVREHGLEVGTDGRIRRPTLDPGAVPERDWPHSP